jgi:hypothetical protein
MVVHSSKDIVASGLTVTGESDRQEGICSGSFSGSWDAVRRQTATERVAATSRYLCCVAENDRCRQRVNECPPDWGARWSGRYYPDCAGIRQRGVVRTGMAAVPAWEGSGHGEHRASVLYHHRGTTHGVDDVASAEQIGELDQREERCAGPDDQSWCGSEAEAVCPSSSAGPGSHAALPRWPKFLPSG